MKNTEIYTQYMYSYPHKTAYRKLNLNITDYYDRLKNNKNDNNLYFHIPFCQTKCGYCNLFSITGKDETYFDKYIDAMENQAIQYKMKDIKFNSLIIGGGTPFVLSAKQLNRLFEIAHTNFKIGNIYTVIETSPNQTDFEKTTLLKSLGVNRISIGVQSFVDEELKILNRHHNTISIQKALECLKKSEFECLNIDLIYGIPHQTTQILQYSIDKALEFCPEEIFIYPLYIKPNTFLYNKYLQSENAYDLYIFMRDYLISKGYFQTSMRRFVNNKSFDNKISCGFDNTISLGCGGRSYIDNLHFCSKYSTNPIECNKMIDDYINIKDYTIISNGYILNEDEQKRNFIIKNLFYYYGIIMTEYEYYFSTDILKDYPLFDLLKSKAYITIDNYFIRMTELGMSLSDYIAPMFISNNVSQKMREWVDLL